MIVTRLVLASSSPRRRELLTRARVAFEVAPADVDERALPDESPEQTVTRLALAKARQIAEQRPQNVVLGADTLVVLDDLVLGKPDNLDEARLMLRTLSGKTHVVLTGVALVRLTPAHENTWVATTGVTFRTLNADDIARYLHLVNTLDKAGAYAIQEHGNLLIDRIDGLRSNVIGLPVEQVIERLRELL